MKIVLVHDYLREYGGAERVVETFHEIWPEAPLYTSFVDWKGLGEQAKRFKDWDIRTSWVQHRPLIKKYISPLRFLAPKIWSSLDLSGFDVVLSSSGWFMCRGVALQRQASSVKRQESIQKRPLHICYIHHPPRNLYGYPTGSDLQKYPLVRAYAAVVNFYLRHYDFETAQAVDYFIANSQETARRVEKFYRRDSTVIYPPIEVASDKRPSFAKASEGKQETGKTGSGRQSIKVSDAYDKSGAYFLSVGRLSWAKRVDLIIKACNQLKLPLKVVGTGKEEPYLKSIAARPPSAGAEDAAGWSPTVEFMGSVSDQELAALYAGAKALIFAALGEDFGMVPVEAMAHGTPVIALAQGGVKETVVEGKTGMLFGKPEIKELIETIERFNESYHKHNYSEDCRKQAEKFSKEKFKKAITEFVKSHSK